MRYAVLGWILGMAGAIILIPAALMLVTQSGSTVTGQSQNSSISERKEKNSMTISVYLVDTGQVLNIGLEEYVKKVVAAEMPAEFEIEALKAQAVAVRTYALKHMKAFGAKGFPEYGGAEITTDYKKSGGQAFANEDELRARWGSNYEKYWQKISSAVDSTEGIFLTYKGEVITAVFHSTSGGRTASAKEVWGTDCDYLKSVACPWDELSPKYTDSKEITLAQMQFKLGAGAEVAAIAPNISQESAVSILERTESGRVGKVKIGSKIISGKEARESFELRSANFTIEPIKEPAGSKFLIKTIGYGHGVGLCQYGANGQAKEGKDFRQILTYYYSGVTLSNIK